jgi:hypothetical protein
VQEDQRFRLALLFAAILAGALLTAGCAAMSADQQAYNTQQCQSFGLKPGSDPYIQCMSQGANAYAASRSNNNGAAPSAVTPIAVLPFGIGIPVEPQPPAKNTSCRAPTSTPKGGCPGCSVSCSGQQASCTAGQEFPGGSDICMQGSSCTCQ